MDPVILNGSEGVGPSRGTTAVILLGQMLRFAQHDREGLLPTNGSRTRSVCAGGCELLLNPFASPGGHMDGRFKLEGGVFDVKTLVQNVQKFVEALVPAQWVIAVPLEPDRGGQDRKA